MISPDSGSVDDSASTVDLGDDKPHQAESRPELQRVDNYRIECELGRGGMGDVYLATEQGLGRQVALKILQSAIRTSATQVKRFLLEARAAAQLSHDHIVPIYHVGEFEGRHYFAMRYIQGCDLGEVIRQARHALKSSAGSASLAVPADSKTKSKVRSSDSTAKEREESSDHRIDLSVSSFVGSARHNGTRSAHKLAVSVALIGQAVADALQHAHQHGIIHRDIKPSNLMLDHTNKIWVTDFGLAQLQGAPDLTKTGDVVGTWRYMSPEQASGRRAFIDHRTDIYSLGITLYELATLEKAYRGETQQEVLRSITFERPMPIRKINPKLPRDLETIICKATERNPTDRYQSAMEMAADLQRFANSQKLVARRPSRLRWVRDWIWERPALALMALCMLILFSGCMVIVASIENQRADENSVLLRKSQGKQWQNLALLYRDANPGLGILAGLAGAEAVPGAVADRALMAAVDASHELHTLPIELRYPGKCVCSDNGQLAVVCHSSALFGRERSGAIVVNLLSNQVVGQLKDELSITDAAFFDGDRYLLTNSVSSDGTGKRIPFDKIERGQLKVWDANSLNVIKTLPSSSALRISADNYSRLNQQLVIPNADMSAVVLDLRDFSQAMVLPKEHTQPVVQCAFSPDGTRIVTSGLDELVVLWDAKTGQVLRKIHYKSQRPASTKATFTPDSRQVCISGESATRFLDVNDADVLEVVRAEQLLGISSGQNLAYLREGNRKTIRVFNSVAHMTMARCETPQAIDQAVPVFDDRYLAVLQNDEVFVFSTTTGERVCELRGHLDVIQSLTAIPGKSELLTVSVDGTLRRWDVRSDRQRRSLQVPVESASAPLVAQDADGRNILVGSIKVLSSTYRSLSHPDQVNVTLDAEVVACLSDGNVLSVSKDAATIWSLATQRKLASVRLNEGRTLIVKKVLEVPKLQQLILHADDNEVYLWDRAANQVNRITDDVEKAKAVALDSTGTRLLIGSTASKVYSLDLATFARDMILSLPALPLDFDAFEPSKLLVTTVNEAAYVIDLEKKLIQFKLSRPETPLRFARYVADGKIVTTGSSAAKSIDLWQSDNGQLIESVPSAAIFDSVLSADRTKLAIATRQGTQYWNFVTNEKIEINKLYSGSLAFVGDSLVMATEPAFIGDLVSPVSPQVYKIVVWDESTKVERAVANFQHGRRIIAARESGSFLVVGYEYGAQCMDAITGNPIVALSGHVQPLLSISVRRDGKRAFTSSRDGLILEHAIESGKHTVLGSHAYPISASIVSTDGTLMFTADSVTGVHLWDLERGNEAYTEAVDGKEIAKLLISSNGLSAAAILDQQTIRVWNLRTRSSIDLIIEEGIQNAALSPNGQKLIATPGKRPFVSAHPVYTEELLKGQPIVSVVVFDTLNGQEIRLPVDGYPVDSCFVHAGKRLAVLTSKGIVQVFDTSTLKPAFTINGQRRITQLLTSDPDSQSLFTSAKDRVLAWSMEDGTLQADMFIPHAEQATIAMFSWGQTRGSFRLFLHDDVILKVPADCVDYAAKIVPRKVSSEERLKLLDTIEVH